MIEHPPINPDALPALTLAYLGDAIYELWVRNHLISKGIIRVNELHRMAVKYVNAGTQSKVVSLLDDVLTEKEMLVLRRGRNAKSGRQPKNSEMIEYRRATGLEALVGYLYLQGEKDRLDLIFSFLIDLVEKEHSLT